MLGPSFEELPAYQLGGPPLASGGHYQWRVRVWDSAGTVSASTVSASTVSAWSAPASFEVELAPADWHASWIGLGPLREDFAPPSQPGRPDPVAAAVSEHTSVLKSLVAFRPGFVLPAVAAHTVATLQRFTGNRLLLNVVTGGYMPEYGRTTGGVISAVTKSGSNEFHGSIFGNFTPGILTGPRPAITTDASVFQFEGLTQPR